MKLGIAIIHGIGRQKHTYADDFIERIQKKYQKVNGTSELIFEPICWQQEIEQLQDDLFEKVKTLNWKALRSLLIGYAGDAICYQPIQGNGCGFYLKIHETIDKSLQNLSSKLDPDSPLIIISHSLGTIVTSNFIWDSHHDSELVSPKSKDLIKRLKCLYTMGSPLALWSLRYPNGGQPLTLNANWYNLYYMSDIIGSPVKLINQHYSCISNLEDIKIPSRNLLTGWNPMSHNSYWTETFVINHIVNNLLLPVGEQK